MSLRSGKCLVVALGACSTSPSKHQTSIKPTLTLSSLDDAQIVRLIEAARALDLGTAYYIFERLSIDGACATKDAAGNLGVASCTTTSGITVTGSAMSDRRLGIVYEDLTVSALGKTLEINGRGRAGGFPAANYAYPGIALLGADGDVVMNADGISVHSDLVYRLERADPSSGKGLFTCVAEGNGVELPGIGGAIVTGGWSGSGPPGGAADFGEITLTGVDSLTATDDPAGCFQWSIDGSARSGTVSTCPQDPLPP